MNFADVQDRAYYILIMEESKPLTGATLGRVVLAHEPLFQAGPLRVEPQTRRLCRGEDCATLEPRVMQVLVALWRAGGNVVTRDELIATCWSGRVVGDDSINRVIAQLRQLSAGIAAGCFSVETVRGVGHRLIVTRVAAESLRSCDRWRRRTVLGSIVSASAFTGCGLLLLRSSRAQQKPQQLAVQHYQRALENRGQSSLLHAEQSVAYLREATRLDPEFAQAWGALAWGYRALLEFDPRNDALRLKDLARSAATRALELDPSNADAKAALLLLQPFYRNWRGIETGCRRLLKQHPSHSLIEYLSLIHI